VKLKLDQHKRIDLTLEQLEALLAEIKERLEPEQFEIVHAMAETIRLLSQAVEQKSTSIARLLKMMFGSGSEKTRQVLDQVPQAASVDGDDTPADPGTPNTEGATAATAPRNTAAPSASRWRWRHRARASAAPSAARANSTR